MEKITFENASGNSVEFGRLFPNLLQNITGISGPPASTITQRKFNQDGVTYYNTLLNPRLISLDFSIRANTVAELKAKAYDVVNLFNPKEGLGVLTYENDHGEWQIPAAVYDAPAPTGIETPLVKTYSVGLYCPDPAFESINETQLKLEGFVYGLTLPYTIPYRIGQLGPETVINYTGTLNAPLLIEFRGASTQPKVTKAETGEFVEVELEMLAGESLFVNTDPNNIDVYKVTGGVRTSAFNYITKDSSYPVLTPGTNTMEFIAAAGSPEVYLYYREKYSGVT